MSDDSSISLTQDSFAEIAQDSFSQASTQLHPGELGAAFSKMFLSLAILIALLFLSYWFLKKFVQAKSLKGVKNGSIHILEKRALSHKTMLYLIEVEGKKTLVAESQLEVKTLTEIHPEDLGPIP